MNKKTWQSLEKLQAKIRQQRLVDLFANDPDRFNNFSVESAGLFLDYSRNFIDDEIIAQLLALAESCDLKPCIEALFNGEPVNNTEKRPALHTALRNEGAGLDSATRKQVADTYQRMRDFVDVLHSGKRTGASGRPITDVVNIGIGGSDLGPVMACSALAPYDVKKTGVHFVSSLDPEHLRQVLAPLSPETTLFIVSSKSFSTIETRKNAEAARQWCLDNGIGQQGIQHHFVAISTNIDAVREFGIDENNVFPMWDWVGGRYSLWSAIGLPVAIMTGMDSFDDMRHGGQLMDQHFRTAAFSDNMPVILGLLSVWYNNFFDSATQIVIPYNYNLRLFPSYLQQLEMESNGKRVTRDGRPVDHQTKGAIFGDAGTNTQHSFHQLLHQGTRLFPVDFIAPVNAHHPVGDQHDHLYANCLSQSHTLMVGKNLQQVEAEMRAAGCSDREIADIAAHKVVPGNKPSNTIAMRALTPQTLGALIALYEHKVYTESVIWDINAFDQWGVELGKIISDDVYRAMSGEATDITNGSTLGLIDYFNKKKKK